MSYLSGLGDRLSSKEEQAIRKLDIDNLIPSTNNFYGIRDIEELAESIKESGLLHNLVVRDLKNGKYEILSGERRYRALKLIGAKRVMCQVKELSDADAELLLIKANVEQRELTPYEKMEAIKRLEKLYKDKKAKGEQIPSGKLRDIIGKDMGMSGTQAGRYQKIDRKLIEPLKDKIKGNELNVNESENLTKLIEPLQEKFNEGKITIEQVETLTKLNIEEQEVMDKQIKDLGTEEIDILINGIKQPIREEDEDLISEFNQDTEDCSSVENNCLDELNKILKSDNHPRLIIVPGPIINLGTSKIDYDEKENLLKISISDFGRPNVICVDFNCFKKVEKINKLKIKPLILSISLYTFFSRMFELCSIL